MLSAASLTPSLPVPLPPALAGCAPGPRTDSAAAPEMPGHRAMWVAISLELFEFAVFFGVYFGARWFHPQAFQDGAARLWTMAGVAVTGVMVTSGYFLVRAVRSMRADRRSAAQRWLAAALLLGLAYPALKALEWQWNAAHGIHAGAGIFVVVYYYLTINHFVHACWGLLGMGWGLARLSTGAYSAQDCRGLESLAVYWHATDLVWLMVFSLFYVFA